MSTQSTSALIGGELTNSLDDRGVCRWVTCEESRKAGLLKIRVKATEIIDINFDFNKDPPIDIDKEEDLLQRLFTELKEKKLDPIKAERVVYWLTAIEIDLGPNQDSKPWFINPETQKILELKREIKKQLSQFPKKSSPLPYEETQHDRTKESKSSILPKRSKLGEGFIGVEAHEAALEAAEASNLDTDKKAEEIRFCQEQINIHDRY